jgi:hydrogenase expression/formation protein HypC
MCLAIPGKVIETFNRTGMQMARVQFGGVTREACLEYVPETQVGEYATGSGASAHRLNTEPIRRSIQLVTRRSTMKISLGILAAAIVLGVAYSLGPDLARYMKIRSM